MARGKVEPAIVRTPDYQALAAFRYEIRKFLAFSEHAARAAGLEPQQHQALLAIRGLADGSRPTIGTIAERLCIQHHTAVGLIDMLEARAMVARERSDGDRREVLVKLTRNGQTVLRTLSRAHQDQLQAVGPQLLQALSAILTAHARPRRRSRTE